MECIANELEMERARFMLITMGVLPSKKGFNYLADCIYLFSLGGKSLHEVYLDVSEKYDVSMSNLDRCMRTCLGSLSSTDTIDRINRMARCQLVGGGTIFTCSSFISLLSEFLRSQSYLNF